MTIDLTIPHQVIQGDCLEVLKSMPDGCVDAVVTDPPYSSGGMVRGDRMTKTSNKYRGWSQNEDGSSKEPEAEYPEFTGDNRDQRSFLYWCALWWGECRRILKPGGLFLVATDWRQLPTTTDAVQAGGLVWRGIVVWDKGIGRPMMGRFRNHVEYWCWGSNGPMNEPKDHAVYPSSVFRVTPPGSDDREHMTEKPVELLTGLMEIVPPGMTILDPFCGSGTTGVACVQTGRRFIGIEIEPKYVAIARRRIADAAPLFVRPTQEEPTLEFGK
jgi:site-specific DNA-methyltransferase (adenine-specific)